MDALPAFVVIAVLLIVTPGPDMALIAHNAIAGGRGPALFTAFGIMVGLLVWAAASVLGLAALLATSAEAFRIVTLVGAAYLVYLGVRTLLSLCPVADVSGSDAIPMQTGSAFRQGLLTNLLNPKIAVLFTGLIPQFVSPGPAAALESLVLAGIFISLGLFWITGFAIVASAAAQWLRRPRVNRVITAVTGTVLVGFGARLAIQSR